jgi:biotin transport system substrate-specific component
MNSKTKNMITIAVMTAVTCILGPLSINIGVVPISFTNLAIYFSLYLLGTKKGLVSYILYMLIGLVGVPVFSGFTGGLPKLVGPTGGYIVGFIFLALISGVFIEKFENKKILCIIGMILGTAVCYLFGTVWFILSTKTPLAESMALCVFPFLPGDFIKILIAAFVGSKIRLQLKKSGLV